MANANDALKFVTSIKGNQLLCYKGHTYRKDKATPVDTYWKCRFYDKYRCSARAVTRPAANGAPPVIEEKKIHNHPPDALHIDAVETLNRVYTAAEAAVYQPPGQIVAAVVANVSPDVQAVLPPLHNMKRSIQRTRKRAQLPYANPANIQALNVPIAARTLPGGEDFLKYDSGAGARRFLLFTTDDNLTALANSQHFFSDGTFSIVPTALFQQLYTIHCVHVHTVVPSVYVLMTHKDEQMYSDVLIQLRNLKPAVNPLKVLTDFERGAINAYKTNFPNARQSGCFFHYSQCLFRKIQSIPHLIALYTADPQFAQTCKMFGSLAFLPVNRVVDGYYQLIQSPYVQPHFHLMGEFLAYFELTWIGVPVLINPMQRHAPLYEIGLWNCHQSILNGEAKTTNHVEGWHRGFNTMTHPNFFTFLELLKKEQALTALKIQQINAGNPPIPGRRVYRDLAQRLQNLVQDFVQAGNHNVLTFLRGCSYNYDYQV